MREIKFRAWQDNKMITSDEGCGIYATKHFLDRCYEDCNLMQYTGLKDKNGKEIYEGDIVQWEDYGGYNGFGEIQMFTDVVKFEGGAFQMVCQLPSEDFEIIGNAYENPELLK